MSVILSPSLLSADFLRLEQEIEMINRSDADWLHLDVMDGVFAPNISLGFPAIEQLSGICTKKLDAHLMIVEPQKFIPFFEKIGVYMLNVHYEACSHLNRVVNQIKESGMQAGVTLNPHTPVEVLTDILDYVDMVLLMSVNPGFSGQKFIPRTYDKIRRLRAMIEDRGLDTKIQIDGGVTVDNIGLLREAGADVFVAGNAVFKAADPIDMIKQMKLSACK